jgi:hypothetical protein
VGKVNKPGAVTAVRSTRSGRRSGAPKGASDATSKKGKPLRATPRTKGLATTKRGRKKGSAVKLAKASRPKPKTAAKGRSIKGGRAAKEREVPVITYRIKGLDPLAKCGPSTTVRALYRVDESVDGAARPHLVFLDRHGWYCEHGRDCPAVGFARKHGNASTREVRRT